MIHVMPSECLAGLVATSKKHCSQIHSFIIGISISDSRHASAAVNGEWSQSKSSISADTQGGGLGGLGGQIAIQLSCDMTAVALVNWSRGNGLHCTATALDKPS